jgi:hypothetical protein
LVALNAYRSDQAFDFGLPFRQKKEYAFEVIVFNAFLGAIGVLASSREAFDFSF